MVGLQGALGDLAAKVAAGEPLTSADRDALVSTSDLLAVGMLADEARRRLHENRVTFVRVARVPCRPKPGERPEFPPAAGEIRIEGPIGDLSQALERIREVVRAAGGRPVSAFSLNELTSYSTDTGIPQVDVCLALRDAGLELIAGAEFDRLDHPVAACESAARAGLGLARVTIAEQPKQILLLFAELRSAQSTLGTLRAFAPLPRMFSAVAPPTGYDDVKQVALARILLENVPTIQVDWSLYGPKLAQVALTFGADDLDMVSPIEERPPEGPSTSLGAGGSHGWRRSTLQEVRRNITSASLVPVERNGRFELV